MRDSSGCFIMQHIFSGLFIDAKPDIDFRYNYGCDDLHRERERERMTLVVPQARAWCSACNGKLWPRAGLFSVVSEECRCHMRCLSPYALLVRLVGRTKEKRKTTIRHECVCVQTNESKGRYVCGKMTGGGRDLAPSLSLWADPAFESCGARPTHTDGLQPLRRSSFIICLLLPVQFIWIQRTLILKNSNRDFSESCLYLTASNDEVK